jgi:hypothetical protein
VRGKENQNRRGECATITNGMTAVSSATHACTLNFVVNAEFAPHPFYVNTASYVRAAVSVPQWKGFNTDVNIISNTTNAVYASQRVGVIFMTIQMVFRNIAVEDVRGLHYAGNMVIRMGVWRRVVAETVEIVDFAGNMVTKLDV